MEARQSVDITSHFNGETRRAENWLLVPYDIPSGNLAAYFPEANSLVPLHSTAVDSNTPTSKWIVCAIIQRHQSRRGRVMASRTYLQLVRENKDFRQLWIAAVISMLGEWFNTIALFFLILEYTGSEFLLGLLFTVRMAGFAILQPFIGLMADRFNRKMLMIVSNLMQAGLALCFLLVNDSSDIVWMIGLSGLMMVLHGVYMTAERAALPNVVSEEDLATANALDAASWSTALCLGAMLGGVVVSIWGTDAAFIVDSITFIIGTLFLITLTIHQTIDESMKGPGSRRA